MFVDGFFVLLWFNYVLLALCLCLWVCVSCFGGLLFIGCGFPSFVFYSVGLFLGYF